MFSKEIFAQNLRDILKSRGMSQNKLSKEIGISQQAVTQFCGGHNLPSIETLIAIADALDVSIDELVGRVSRSQASQ